MFIDVENMDAKPVIEGFMYKNIDGYEEKVVIKGGCVVVQDSTQAAVTIYNADVPKLIKALQAAEGNLRTR